jgi:tousled-like kinase
MEAVVYITCPFSLMQQMKVLSDLLIAVSKAERQEARMRLKQESLRLGNIGVMR